MEGLTGVPARGFLRTARAWKWIGASLAVVAVGATVHFVWADRRETAAKAELAAEIRAERAGRTWPSFPMPTGEEEETAELYRTALLDLDLQAYWGGDDSQAFWEAMDSVPWSTAPQAVGRMLAANAKALEGLDAALARGACRFEKGRPPSNSHSRCATAATLIDARGHEALAADDVAAALADVTRLLRIARDFGAQPSVPDEENCIPLPYLQCSLAEQRATILLAAIATAPSLPPEIGPALLSTARTPWETAAAHLRALDFLEEATDALHLRLLGSDARAFLDRQDGAAAEFSFIQKFGAAPTAPTTFEQALERVRDRLSSRTPVPPAASLRWLRDLRRPVVAGARRRDLSALAPGGPHDRYGDLLGFLGPRAQRVAVYKQTRIAVVRTAAAIRAFQLAEGRPPRDLAEVVQTLPADVTLDPFDGKPLLYETEGEGWRVGSRVWPEAKGEDNPPAEVRFPRPAK